MTTRSPLNALMVSNYPSDTGYAWWLMEHFWLTLAGIVTQRGGRAYVAYPRITALSPEMQNGSIEAVELTLPWTTREQMLEARQFIREHGIRLVYFTDRPYLHGQYLALRRHGVRSIVVHDHAPGDRPPSTGVKGFVKALRNRLPWISADRVFAVSELMRIRSIESARIPLRKCVTVQNGIPPVRATPSAARRVREELALEEGAVLVVTTGRAHPYKRHDFIVDCAAHVRAIAPELPLHFALVGDGPSIPSLRAQITRLALADRVHLLGFRRDVHDVLGAADFAIHAALGEAFSLAIVEYMSAGLPVLVPNIPSVRQAICDGDSGIVFPPNDVAAAAAGVVALARDARRRRSMGCAAKRRAETEYSLTRCTDAFRRAVEELVGP